MKTSTIFLFIAILALLVLLSCSRKAKTTLDDNTKHFSLSEKIGLGINEEATTDDGKLSIKPVSVKDSRCPKNVNCIRAGEAFVELWLKTRNKEETIKMATPASPKMGGSDRVVFDGYSIQLVNVTPYPEQPKPEDAPATEVILVVEKKM